MHIRTLVVLAAATLSLAACGKSETHQTQHITPSPVIAANPDIVTDDILTEADVRPSFQKQLGAFPMFGIHGTGDVVDVYYYDQSRWKATTCQHLNDGRWMCAGVNNGLFYFMLTKSGN